MPRPTVDRTTASGPTKVRQVRVPQQLWADSCAHAAEEGLTISEVVRVLLRGYVAGEIELVEPAQSA